MSFSPDPTALTPPEDPKSLRTGEPSKSAAGVTAVLSSFRHLLTRTGPVRTVEGMLRLNQKDGFDCPSCAWPDPDGHRSAFEFCENGAKALASETTSARVDPAFFAAHSIAELGAMSDMELDKAGRLTHPVVLLPGSDRYEAISWEEAFALAAAEWQDMPTPDHAVFYTSGRASNEAAFLFQLFARQLGTNNLPDCSNMCHESSGAAMKDSVGVGKGTVTLEDIYESGMILLMGQNPGTNHPRMLSALQTAVRNGSHLVAVNPLREAGLLGFAHPQEVGGALGHFTALASDYLTVRLNGDMALMRGMAKTLVEDGTIDHDFIHAHTTGFEEYATLLKSQNWEELEALSGLTREDMQRTAREAAKRKKLITCWAMGLTQHRNAVDTIREVVNVHLLLGAIGKPGAGLCPVRGHSNVQGDRTMGIFEKMPESFHDALDREFNFQSPRPHGMDTVAAIQAMHDGRVRVFCALGGNFLQAAPDTEFTAEALRACRLTIHICTKLNRSHLVTGRTALILPCLGRSEEDLRGGVPQSVTVENSMSIVHASRGRLTPASPWLLSETAIVAGLAAAALEEKTTVPWGEFANDYDLIRDAVSRVVPHFENFNERVRHPGGFHLYSPARRRIWDTPTGRAGFSSAKLSAFTTAPGRFVLQTLRSHDQFNTTVYGLNDRYRGIGHGRRVVFVNPQDLKNLGIKPMQPVDLTSHWSDGTRVAPRFLAVPYEMPSGNCAAYFPEANVLVPLGSTAEISGTPTSKSIEVSITPSANP
ncbi:MAG: FdhF/YdeP family oxidoreductase [Verrucomicrobiaceae bacterium]|nr:MAG: FdhF/YdeP family oxidoreductase [Verrucomicrobiaceae bacterium]